MDWCGRVARGAWLLILVTNGALWGWTASASVVQPRVVTEPVRHDSDDPAVWIHPQDPAASLIIGTDKDVDGALYVFGLDGRARQGLTVRGLLRPNNVDVIQGVSLGGRTVDLAVVAERFAHRLRIYTLPDLRPVDGGGIAVFEGERAREVMGIALYRRPIDGALFTIVSRAGRFAPKQGYLHQYRIMDDGTGVLRGVWVRAFGEWSGRKEIEALSVDPVAGHLFVSDETFGLRQYSADPATENADSVISIFGTHGFARDHEGSAVLRREGQRPLLFVSDQQAGSLRVFGLAGSESDRREPELLGRIRIAARETDGIDVTSAALPGFPGGMLVAMSDDRTFHLYAVDDLLAALEPVR